MAIIPRQAGSADRTPALSARWRFFMDTNSSLSELDDRIAIIRDNLRQLVEQAAAASGGQSEDRAAERIAQQSEELDKLNKAREQLLAKKS
jgi:hypothetical protein